MSAVIWCPFPDEESARAIASTLLDEKLIGCANLLGPMTSLFEWDEERGEGREAGVLFKTDDSLLESAMARLEELHPYDTPAILGWPCIASAGTREWLGALAQPPNDAE